MKCKNCKNYLPDDEWCPKKCDSPDIELERDCDKYECMTNSDRIRKMTDEELAEFWESGCDKVIDCKFCEEPINEYGSCTGQCRKEYLRWLQKEVE